MKASKTAGGSITGRPTVINQDVLRKLEDIFAMDGTVEEACLYADIAPSTYYLYAKENPDFSERVTALRNKPVLLARQTVIKDLKTPSGAQWYLSRKRKTEFGGGIENTTPQGGMNVYQFFSIPKVQEEIKAMEDKIKEALITETNVQS